MAKGRRFLATSAAAGLAGLAVAGRLVARRQHDGAGEAAEELLGSVRGRPRTIRGPLSSRLYTETLGPDGGSNGSGAGTIVLTHGWCVSEAIWHHQKQALGTGPGAFSVVSWDLPGHGHSTPLPAGRLTLERGVESLARVVDDCVEDQVVLVGHSLGGVLTMSYLLADPETVRRRVRGVVLAATPLVHLAWAAAGRWPGSSLEARMLGHLMQLAVQNGVVDRWFGRDVGSRDPRAASYRLIRLGFGPDPSPSHIRFVRDLAAEVPPAVRADTFRAMLGFDLRPRLHEVGVPVVVVIGGRDRLVSPDETRAAAALLPRARIDELPEAGHALFLEHHERFSGLVRRFATRRMRQGAARPAARAAGRGAG